MVVAPRATRVGAPPELMNVAASVLGRREQPRDRLLVVDLAVEVARDHVVEGVLDRRRHGMAVGDRTQQGVALAGLADLLDRLLAATVERADGQPRACPRRALSRGDPPLERP